MHCCVTPESRDSILHFVFDGMTGTVTDLSAGITGQFGSSTNFYPGDYDSDDAWPIKDRGYYFKNSIFHLPPYGDLTDDPIVFNVDVSIEMWLKSDVVTDDRCILGKWTSSYAN